MIKQISDSLFELGNDAYIPVDAEERSRALDPTKSFLVQAPAGSGKTQLLTQRFLRLLAQAENPDEIVAITFTNAAAAEMRQRILDELEKAQRIGTLAGTQADTDSLPALATRALERSQLLGWQILDQPTQLRITTIDAFCRGLALQRPLKWGWLSGLGGKLDMVNNPKELYRRAATRTIERLRGADSEERRSIEQLMLWRDNYWKDVEDLIVEMLEHRNRWYQEFVFTREQQWDALRKRLEAPFCRAVRSRLERLSDLLNGPERHSEFALQLARSACENQGKSCPLGLAERAEMPTVFVAEDGENEYVILEDGAAAHSDLANFLLTREGEWRSVKGLNVNHGFPSTDEGRAAKARFGEFVETLNLKPGLHAALKAFLNPIPTRYTEEEWQIIRHCFAVMRVAAGELQVVFAEAGSVDFTEVSQIAIRVLAPENGFPSDFAMRQADSIHHLLVDEFQDTSRNQHQLLSRLIAAWPEREGRSCFCVGDPMQSIYGFREAEVELFERLKSHGLEVSSSDSQGEPFRFEFLTLKMNFRSAPGLVNDLNGHFENIFAEEDDSGVHFSPSEPARSASTTSPPARTALHLAFTRSGSRSPLDRQDPFSLAGDPEVTRRDQLEEMVGLISAKLAAAQASGVSKYRIAVLARTKKSLIVVADALRKANLNFRAIELVPLRERPEILDALALARAVLNPADRTAWLAVLRAPWCGLSLAELHLLTSADDAGIVSTPVPTLLEHRLPALLQSGALEQRAFNSADRVARVLRDAIEMRTSMATMELGSWLHAIWKSLGGGDTVNAEQRGNLRLLWDALDKLPKGELDLLSPELNLSLDRLCALPDPNASSDFGVQLMTIHKSKGLEFEVVIVPDLEAGEKKSDHQMISWLERGLADSGESEELTEFLIAPIQTKGAEASVAKKWVDSVKRARATQESRRMLYVAATRAREELHLFARPKFSIAHQKRTAVNEAQDQPKLSKPSGLLQTAWPAFSSEIEDRFSVWIESFKAQPLTRSEHHLLDGLAASAEIKQMPNPGGTLSVLASARQTRPTILRRLPADYKAPEPHWKKLQRPGSSVVGELERSIEKDQEELTYNSPLYSRTPGGLQSRLEGIAIHAYLEQLSQLRKTMEPSKASEQLSAALPAVLSAIRSRGLTAKDATQMASSALSLVRTVTNHPVGAWVFHPHPEGDAEVRWTGMVETDQGLRQQRTLRPDRIFQAPIPAFVKDFANEENASPVWWIIDFKSSPARGVDPSQQDQVEAFLLEHRGHYERQLQLYAQMLRNLKASAPIRIRTGIYYPRLGALDSWFA